jgi:superfamily II DNA or RNA helicase
MLTVSKVNDVYLKVDCDPGTSQELSDYFTFTVPGARFMPQVQNRFWDGKIRLFNQMTKQIYFGLYPKIEEFCKQRNYTLDIKEDTSFLQAEFSLKEVDDLAKSVKLPKKFTVRDYQKKAIAHAVRNKRCLLLSPTASGKSLIIYMLSRYYPANKLIIVPTTALVHQMTSDFEDYGYQDKVHKITAGEDKDSRSEITITTWQSIYKMPKKWFSRFKVVIGDEAHLFKAKSLSTIMGKLEQCPWRFGFTGTLDGTVTHKLVLEGLFGPVEKVTTTAELIKSKHLSKFKINIITLKYSDQSKILLRRAKYQDEIDFIVRNEARNRFIKNLCTSLDGNTLALFNFVDKHGKVLYNMLKDQKRSVFFVHGGVKGDERDNIRQIVEKEHNAIIVASYGTFSTGVNIRNLHNIVFASPSKSRVRNLQSIGRGLRTADGKREARLFDLVDDLRYKGWKNYSIEHFGERLKVYNEEQFPYKLYQIDLKE